MIPKGKSTIKQVGHVNERPTDGRVQHSRPPWECRTKAKTARKPY